MTEPDYRPFNITGQNFDAWPQIVFGWLSAQDTNPTSQVGSSAQWAKMFVMARSNNGITFNWEEPHSLNNPFYLGAITDENNNILWVNDSEPLP